MISGIPRRTAFSVSGTDHPGEQIILSYCNVVSLRWIPFHKVVLHRQAYLEKDPLQRIFRIILLLQKRNAVVTMNRVIIQIATLKKGSIQKAGWHFKDIIFFHFPGYVFAKNMWFIIYIFLTYLRLPNLSILQRRSLCYLGYKASWWFQSLVGKRKKYETASRTSFSNTSSTSYSKRSSCQRATNSEAFNVILFVIFQSHKFYFLAICCSVWIICLQRRSTTRWGIEFGRTAKEEADSYRIHFSFTKSKRWISWYVFHYLLANFIWISGILKFRIIWKIFLLWLKLH